MRTVTIPERLAAGMFIKSVLDGIPRNPQQLRWRQTYAGTFIVLAVLDNSEYVTYLVGEYGAVEGHYFTSFDEAEQDFASRS